MIEKDKTVNWLKRLVFVKNMDDMCHLVLFFEVTVNQEK